MKDLLHWLGSSIELAIGWIFSSSWLPPKDFEFFRWLIIPGYGYGFILIGFAILELIIPERLDDIRKDGPAEGVQRSRRRATRALP